jgi:hypothetical protein
LSKIPLQREEEWQNDPSLDPGWSSIQENQKCYIDEPIGNGENKYPAGRDQPSDTNKMVCKSTNVGYVYRFLIGTMIVPSNKREKCWNKVCPL